MTLKVLPVTHPWNAFPRDNNATPATRDVNYLPRSSACELWFDSNYVVIQTYWSTEYCCNGRKALGDSGTCKPETWISIVHFYTIKHASHSLCMTVAPRGAGVAHTSPEKNKSWTGAPIEDPRIIPVLDLPQWTPYRLLNGHIMFWVKIMLWCTRPIEFWALQHML